MEVYSGDNRRPLHHTYGRSVPRAHAGYRRNTYWDMRVGGPCVWWPGDFPGDCFLWV